MHDLKLSVQLCQSMNIEPFVLINRSCIGDLDSLHQWCKIQNLPILAEIPDDRQTAELYSKGLLPIEHLDYLRSIFAQAARKLIALPDRNKQTPQVLPDMIHAETVFLKSDTNTSITETKNNTVNPVEIAVLSGKGGTGKTSLSACFAQLEKSVVADCDVDAADMHLLLEPQVIESEPFIGGRVMSIDPRQCSVCEKCIDVCEWNAISKNDGVVSIDEDKCEGCGACQLICLTKAIKTHQTRDGQWYWSGTRYGKMSHAVLEPGKENSGKLVTLVRKNAASKMNITTSTTVVLDGSPGTGCPVIASVGGAKAAVIVTEPTVSGLHDLERILDLTEHFKIPAGILVNKADINSEVTGQIKEFAQNRNTAILGQLPYDTAFIQAQQEGKTILEYSCDSEISQAIINIWNQIKDITLSNQTRKEVKI